MSLTKDLVLAVVFKKVIIVTTVAIIFLLLLKGCSSAVDKVTGVTNKEFVSLPQTYEPKIAIKKPKSRAKGKLKNKETVSNILTILQEITRKRLQGKLPSSIINKVDVNHPLVAEAIDRHISNYAAYLGRTIEINWIAVDTLDKVDGNEFIIIKLLE